MNKPIKREDIRKGDRINVKYEYTAASDKYGPIDMHDVEYELIERPVQLPTEPGCYQSDNFLLADGNAPYLLSHAGEWFLANRGVTEEYMTRYAAPLTRVRPVAEVAAEVIAEVRAEYKAFFTSGLDFQVQSRQERLDAIAAKWANS